MQALLGSAKAPANQPVFLAANDAKEAKQLLAPFIWTRDINFGNEDGANRLLVIVYGSEGAFTVVHSSPKFNGVSGVLALSKSVGFTARAATLSISYWREADLPSSSGLYEFQMSHSGTSQGHMVRAFLFKNVNQSISIGSTATKTVTKSAGVPTFQMSITSSSIQDKAVVLAVQSAITGAVTYVAGDHKDNGSNMNDIVEQQARPQASFGGGGFASAHDVVPNSSEAYVWDVKYGAATSIQATVAMMVPINAL